MNTETNKTIAVLPFINRSSNEELEYFSDGITEEIINALSKIQELKVTSRTFSFKGTNRTISEIAKKIPKRKILHDEIGYLMKAHSEIPKTLSYITLIAGASYVATSLLKIEHPNSEMTNTLIMILALPMTLGELGLAVWLLIKGGKKVLL